MFKIGTWVGPMMLTLRDTTKIKRLKVKVTRSREKGVKSIEYMPQTSSNSGNTSILWEIVVAEHNGDGSF